MNMAGADLNLLVAFHALTSERNVTRAAATTGLSQPALSNALKRLRDLFGDRLFVKGRRTMVPTPRALEIAPEIEAAIASIQRVFQQPEFRPERATRIFRLAMTDDIELMLLPTAIRKLSVVAPGLTLHCSRPQGIFKLPLADLQSGTLDFALGSFPHPAPTESGLLTRLLFKARVVCLVRKNHPQVKRRLTLAQYYKLDHVTTFYPGEGPGLIDRMLSARGQTRPVKLSLPHWFILPSVVAKTDLIATVPETVARNLDSRLQVRQMACPLSVPPFMMSLVWHARTHDSASHKWFRKVLIDLSQETFG
jgi:DNA-binding transcriptional LysR family regulator